MAQIVLYDMTARQGDAAPFAAALQELAAIVARLPGCTSVQVLADSADDHAFVFIETWESEQAYAEGSRALPADAFASLKPLFAAKPGRRMLHTAA